MKENIAKYHQAIFLHTLISSFNSKKTQYWSCHLLRWGKEGGWRRWLACFIHPSGWKPCCWTTTGNCTNLSEKAPRHKDNAADMKIRKVSLGSGIIWTRLKTRVVEQMKKYFIPRSREQQSHHSLEISSKYFELFVSNFWLNSRRGNEN